MFSGSRHSRRAPEQTGGTEPQQRASRCSADLLGSEVQEVWTVLVLAERILLQLENLLQLDTHTGKVSDISHKGFPLTTLDNTCDRFPFTLGHARTKTLISDLIL